VKPWSDVAAQALGDMRAAGGRTIMSTAEYLDDGRNLMADKGRDIYPGNAVTMGDTIALI
jgi:hypothetical protein